MVLQSCRVRSRRRHVQEISRKRPAQHSGQHLLVSRLATYAPLVAVFLLALLLGFAGRVLLPQQQQSMPLGGVMMSGMTVLSQASAASQPAVHRRRLIALSSPFRVNPLAGQVNRWALTACRNAASLSRFVARCLQAPVMSCKVLCGLSVQIIKIGLSNVG